MAVPFEQSIMNWLMVGGIIAVLYGLRFLVVMERRMIALEEAVQQVLRKLELDEREILLREKLIEKAVLRPRKKSK